MRALTHGAFSDRMVVPAATELAERALADVAYLGPEDRPAVMAWALAETRVWRIAAWLERNGDFDSKSRPRPALEHLRRWMETAAKARARIGLDPIARQGLRLDTARTAEALAELYEHGLAEGRAALEAAESRSDAPSNPDG